MNTAHSLAGVRVLDTCLTALSFGEHGVLVGEWALAWESRMVCVANNSHYGRGPWRQPKVPLTPLCPSDPRRRYDAFGPLGTEEQTTWP